MYDPCQYINGGMLGNLEDKLSKSSTGKYIYEQIVKNKLYFCITDPNELNKNLRLIENIINSKFNASLLCLDTKCIGSSKFPDLIVYAKKKRKCFIMELKLNVTSRKTTTLKKRIKKAIEQLGTRIPCCGSSRKIKVIVFHRNVIGKIRGLINKGEVKINDVRVLSDKKKLDKVDP